VPVGQYIERAESGRGSQRWYTLRDPLSWTGTASLSELIGWRDGIRVIRRGKKTTLSTGADTLRVAPALTWKIVAVTICIVCGDNWLWYVSSFFHFYRVGISDNVRHFKFNMGAR